MELTPIPHLYPNFGWREVPIEGVDDPLVPVDTLHPRIVDRAEYHRLGMAGSMPRSWVRGGVAERLVGVVEALPGGMGLAVWDGYRPLALQAALFDTYLSELIAVHPDMPVEALEEAAARYVTPPSRSVYAPPPHLTGGAVDLTLTDPDGRPLELGSGFDAFGPESATRALEDTPGRLRDLRRVLFWSMHDAGFTSYAEEWWHFDYGDQFWGLARECPALYGAMPPPADG